MDFAIKTVELFRKAAEIAHKFGADVAVLIVPGDGKDNYVFASSNWTSILKKCVDPEHCPVILLFRPEGDIMQLPWEIDVLKEQTQILEQAYMEAFDIGISQLNLYEVIELEKQIRDRIRCTEERKDQLFIEEYEQSKMLIEVLEGELASTTTEHTVGPGTEILPIATENIQIYRDPPNENTDTNLRL